MPMLTDDEILDALATVGIPRERPWARDVGPYDVTEPTHDLKRLVREIAKRAAPGWQPIESAPRDGTTIDLWVGGEFPARYENCYFGTPHHECYSQYCDSCPEDMNVKAWRWHFFSQQITPTHWMPVPTGPEQNNPPRGPSKIKVPVSPDTGGGPIL